MIYQKENYPQKIVFNCFGLISKIDLYRGEQLIDFKKLY